MFKTAPKHVTLKHINAFHTYRAFLLRVFQAWQFGRGFVILSGLLSDTIAQSSYDSQSADR